MQSFWMQLEDGRKVCSQGQSEYDAKRIVEKLTGVKVKGCTEWQAEGVKPIPYPASPVIWQLDHPVSGKCPPFCHTPDKCVGRSCCPHRYACSE